jgi:hypothetical protein
LVPLQINGSDCSSLEDPSETVSTVSDRQNLIPADKADKKEKADKKDKDRSLQRILYDLPPDNADTCSAFDDAAYYV